jgi:DNA-binding winged helix-turn-helix (wHTH) protein
MNAETSYPLTYRQREVRQVFHCLESGESCCLIASGGAGTLNFLRFLLRQDVQQQYLNLEQQDYFFLLIDLNALAELSEWAVYELLLHTMLSEMETMQLTASLVPRHRDYDTIQITPMRPNLAYQNHFDGALVKRTEDFYRQVVLSKDRLLGQRYFERTVQAVSQQTDLRLVFLLDRFDRIFGRLDPLFFLSLRALRDTFKYRLCFVVTGLTDLTRVREDLSEVEDFYMLFSRNVYGLEPYNRDDARAMLRSLAKRLGANLSENEVAQLIDMSGGHPRLLKTIFWAHHEGRMHLPENATDQLLDDPIVWAECLRLWDGLDQDEQEAMRAIAAGHDPSFGLPDDIASPPTSEAIQLLRLKGLMKQGRDGTYAVFCPLFRDFACRQGLVRGRGVILDSQTGEVWVEGRQVANLTRLEFELLAYLLQHRDCICTRGELAAHLYPGEYGDIEGHIVNEPRIDTLITRLRAKIEPDRTHPKYLITVRGRGYRLTAPPPS